MVVQRHKYRIPIVLLVFGIIFCMVSAMASRHSSGDWFARSGAVLSFVSVVIQFMLSNMKRVEIEKLFNKNLGLKQKLNAIREKDMIHDFISTVSFVTGLVGTIIWGYGDLLF